MVGRGALRLLNTIFLKSDVKSRRPLRGGALRLRSAALLEHLFFI
ncbi:hypothetical protein D1AOALGA4SA_3318 [Olavius algarvensis Delta 1 endosymbiont]|nr:hypothetical protein D1AOALGA4SA_3318 [Olavius algarvensis Delta 1 endosymbiont]